MLVPVTVYHLIWRGFRQAEYFQRWNERYAAYRDAAARAPTVWVHAVSVGEVNAAAPLVNALRRDAPGPAPAGHHDHADRFGSACARCGASRVEHVYLPYDLPGAVARFLAHYQPRLALIMETELWPNLLFGCRDRGIPALPPQRAPVGALAARLPRAGAAGRRARCARVRTRRRAVARRRRRASSRLGARAGRRWS